MGRAMDRVTAPHRLMPALLVLLAALDTVGCTSAGKCRRGEEGCACTIEDTCNGGASCMDGMCVADEDSPTPIRDSGMPSPSAGDCTGETLEQACLGFCEALCQAEQEHCVESACEPGDCEPGGVVFSACTDACDTAECAQDLCETQAESTCEDFGFMSGQEFETACFDSDPRCVPSPDDPGCSNVCGSLSTRTGGDLAGNGVCDDGGRGSDTDRCARTTDCDDCGTRNCVMPGGTCSDNGDCCGFFGPGAFCVDLQTLGPTCLLDCTETGTCPDPFVCRSVSSGAASVCAPPNSN
jgi:hypothetical protein